MAYSGGNDLVLTQEEEQAMVETLMLNHNLLVNRTRYIAQQNMEHASSQAQDENSLYLNEYMNNYSCIKPYGGPNTNDENNFGYLPKLTEESDEDEDDIPSIISKKLNDITNEDTMNHLLKNYLIFHYDNKNFTQTSQEYNKNVKKNKSLYAPIPYQKGYWDETLTKMKKQEIMNNNGKQSNLQNTHAISMQNGKQRIATTTTNIRHATAGRPPITAATTTYAPHKYSMNNNSNNDNNNRPSTSHTASVTPKPKPYTHTYSSYNTYTRKTPTPSVAAAAGGGGNVIPPPTRVHQQQQARPQPQQYGIYRSTNRRQQQQQHTPTAVASPAPYQQTQYQATSYQAPAAPAAPAQYQHQAASYHHYQAPQPPAYGVAPSSAYQYQAPPPPSQHQHQHQQPPPYQHYRHHQQAPPQPLGYGNMQQAPPPSAPGAPPPMYPRPPNARPPPQNPYAKTNPYA